MNKEHITCYSEHGIKIFSKDKKNTSKHPDTKLSTTHLKTIDSIFARNPEYNILYDPYNHLFYSFAWPQDGHYFPTALFVSGDKKYESKVQ